MIDDSIWHCNLPDQESTLEVCEYQIRKTMVPIQVHEIDSGLLSVIWRVETENAVENQEHVFSLEKSHQAPTYLITLSCFSDCCSDCLNEPQPHEIRIKLQEVFSNPSETLELLPKARSKDTVSPGSKSFLQQKPTAVWVSINGGEKQDLGLSPNDVWDSGLFHCTAARKRSAITSFWVWKIKLHLWIKFRTPFEKTIGEKNALDSFRHLLTKQQHCDIQFQFGSGGHIGAHSLILMARSPVFAAMCHHHKPKESTMYEALIDDIQPDIFRQILYFIYSGSCTDSITEESATSLYEAAEKYGLDDLKEELTEYLISRVTVLKVPKLLTWAHVNSVTGLKDSILNFAAEHGKEICRLPAWEELSTSYPELNLEATRRMLDNL